MLKLKTYSDFHDLFLNYFLKYKHIVHVLFVYDKLIYLEHL